MLDAFGGDELVGNGFDGGGLAADQQHLHAVVVVEMRVDGGDDDALVIVLDIGQQRLKVALVVVVEQRDRAGDLLVSALLLVLDKLGTDHVGDGERTVGVALLARHRVEVAEKLFVQRNTEPGDAVMVGSFHGVTVVVERNTKPWRVKRGPHGRRSRTQRR